jgi:hypothetical protein
MFVPQERLLKRPFGRAKQVNPAVIQKFRSYWRALLVNIPGLPLVVTILVVLAYIISAHQIAFTAVADTFGGKAEFRLPQHEHLMVL